MDQRRGIDHVGVCVAFVVHDDQGHILLQKRGQAARDERGSWDVGGGAVEFGETIDQAVRREVLEELCVEPLHIEFLEAGEAHRTNHEGLRTHWIYLLHSVLVDPEKVKIGEPDKIAEIGWFTTKNLPSPLHSVFPKIRKAVKKAGLLK